MRIANGIHMLEIPVDLLGKKDMVHPVLLEDENNVVLIDTGFPKQLEQFDIALKDEGISLDDINRIIITHQDIDHVGSLADILNKSSNPIETIAHSVEKPYIEGEKRQIKLAQMEAKLDYLPEEIKPFYYGMKSFFDTLRVKIDKTVEDREELPFSGGVTVVFTPGHTPGHICLYHKESKTLIAGDALGVENGVLTASPARINFDQGLYIDSLKKLLNYDIDGIITYHGGLFTGNIKQSVSDLLSSLS